MMYWEVFHVIWMLLFHYLLFLFLHWWWHSHSLWLVAPMSSEHWPLSVLTSLSSWDAQNTWSQMQENFNWTTLWRFCCLILKLMLLTSVSKEFDLLIVWWWGKKREQPTLFPGVGNIFRTLGPVGTPRISPHKHFLHLRPSTSSAISWQPRLEEMKARPRPLANTPPLSRFKMR